MKNDDKKVFLNSEIMDADKHAPTDALLASSDYNDDEEELEMLEELEEDDFDELEELEELEDEEPVEEPEKNVEDSDIVEGSEEPLEENADEQPDDQADEQPDSQPSEEQTESLDEAVAELPAEETVQDGPVQEEPVQEEPKHEEPAQAQEASPAPKAVEKKTSTKAQSKKSTVRATAETEYGEDSEDKLDPYKSKNSAATEGVWAAATINVKKSSKKKATTETDSETADKPAKKSAKKPTDDSKQKNVAADVTAQNEKKDAAPVAKAPADKKSTAKKEDKNMSNDEEKVLIEADETKPQHGKFVIKKTDKGNFVYKLYSSNKRVLAVPGGAYKDLVACKGGIQSVINNAATAPIEDQTLKKPVEQKCPKWEIYLDNNKRRLYGQGRRKERHRRYRSRGTRRVRCEKRRPLVSLQI